MCLRGGARLRAPPPLTSPGLRLKLAFARKFYNSNFLCPRRGTDKPEEPIEKARSSETCRGRRFALTLLRAASASTARHALRIVMNAHLVQRRCASSIY